MKNPEQVESSAENNNLFVNNNTASTANHSIEQQWRYAFKLSYIQRSGDMPSNDSIRETMSIKPARSQLSYCSPSLAESLYEVWSNTTKHSINIEPRIQYKIQDDYQAPSSFFTDQF